MFLILASCVSQISIVMIYFQLCAEVGEGLYILKVRPNNPVKTTGGDPIVQVSIFSSPVFDLPERGGASSEGRRAYFHISSWLSSLTLPFHG